MVEGYVHIKKSGNAICHKFQKRKYCNSSSNIHILQERYGHETEEKDLIKNPVSVSVLWQFTSQKIHKEKHNILTPIKICSEHSIRMSEKAMFPAYAELDKTALSLGKQCKTVRGTQLV
jgi:hypothetical protein